MTARRLCSSGKKVRSVYLCDAVATIIFNSSFFVFPCQTLELCVRCLVQMGQRMAMLQDLVQVLNYVCFMYYICKTRLNGSIHTNQNTGAEGNGMHTSNAVRRFAGSALPNGIIDSSVIGSSIIRLPKAIAMFASRACRVSQII